MGNLSFVESGRLLSVFVRECGMKIRKNFSKEEVEIVKRKTHIEKIRPFELFKETFCNQF